MTNRCFPHAESHVTDMALEGHVARLIQGHIPAWPLTALRRNPNLIPPVRLAATTDKGLPDSGCTGLMACQNEYFGKHLTGMAHLYLTTKDAALKAAGDDLVEQLNQAQGKDGYLGVERRALRLGAQNGNWDIWGHYHIIYGLLQWYKATGSVCALRMAVSAADYCVRAFDQAPTYAVGSEFANYAICHAYAVLYQETGDPKYLAEAKRIIFDDWPKHGNWLNDAIAGKDFYQSDEPRWETLHSVMALGSLCEITGDTLYRDMLGTIWHSILKTDRHNSGAFATYEKAVGQPYDNNGIETCSCVAWAALTTEYLRLTGDALAADELELTYFNTLLGALMDNLRDVTYNTPMDGTRISTQEDLDWAYNSGVPDFNCCQANACRALGCLSQWAALTDETSLSVNYYGPCAIRTRTPGGQEIVLTVQSDYPRRGSIQITLSGMERPEAFDLRLRIPAWSRKNAVAVNGVPRAGIVPGTYLNIPGPWKNGDTICLELELSVHYWVGESRVEGKTSVYYGPILLTLDSRFNGPDASSAWLTAEALSSLQVRAGTDSGCWLLADLTAEDNTPVTLIDFASAGKSKAVYQSWLNVRHGLSVIPRVSDGTPVWLNGLKP